MLKDSELLNSAALTLSGVAYLGTPEEIETRKTRQPPTART
jgi:hypothetical protein